MTSVLEKCTRIAYFSSGRSHRRLHYKDTKHRGTEIKVENKRNNRTETRQSEVKSVY